MAPLREFFKAKKVLITGHTGFKGSWLTQVLVSWGADVIGYALNPNTNPNLFETLNLKASIKHHLGDIQEYEKILNTLKEEQPEIVIHLAAQPIVRDSYDNPLHTHRTNIMGTANLLQAIKEVPSIRAAVMITTDKVYKNKEWVWPYRETDELGGYDPYSASKACAELIINSYVQSFLNTQEYGDKHHTLIASARAGNVIGGGDWGRHRLITDIVRSIFEKNEEIVIRSPQAIRPWQFVLEPLFGYLTLAKRLYEGDVNTAGAWNFAPDSASFITVESLVKKAISTIKKGGYCCQMDTSKHEPHLLKLDSTKAKCLLEWRHLLSIEKTLAWTFDWYRNFYDGGNVKDVTFRQITEYSQIFSTNPSATT